MIKLQCSKCKATLKLNANLRGKRIKCPRCKTSAVVPDPGTTEEEKPAGAAVSVSPTKHDVKPLELDGPWIEPEPSKKKPATPAATPTDNEATAAEPSGPLNLVDDDFQDLGDLLGEAPNDGFDAEPDDDLFSAAPVSKKKKKKPAARPAPEEEEPELEGGMSVLSKLPISADALKKIPVPVIYGGLFAVGLLLTVLTLQFFGGGSGDSTVSEGPTKIEKTGFSDTDEAVSRIDDTLDEMQRLLKAGKLRDFAVRFAPLKEVARLRDAELNDLEMPAVPRDRLLSHISKLGSAKPAILDDGWGLELRADEKVKAGDVQTTAGYGKNIDTVLDNAIADLEEGNFAAFVDRMFPESAKTQMLKNGPERSVLAELEQDESPILVEAMLADLRAMRKMDPDVSGKQATYILEPYDPPESFPQPTRSPRSFAPEAREIRMSLVGGSWRFYDNFAEHNMDVSGKRVFRLSFERVGDSWRLSKWP